MDAETGLLKILEELRQVEAAEEGSNERDLLQRYRQFAGFAKGISAGFLASRGSMGGRGDSFNTDELISGLESLPGIGERSDADSDTAKIFRNISRAVRVSEARELAKNALSLALPKDLKDTLERITITVSLREARRMALETLKDLDPGRSDSSNLDEAKQRRADRIRKNGTLSTGDVIDLSYKDGDKTTMDRVRAGYKNASRPRSAG